jgi:hypothetical protein
MIFLNLEFYNRCHKGHSQSLEEIEAQVIEIIGFSQSYGIADNQKLPDQDLEMM